MSNLGRSRGARNAVSCLRPDPKATNLAEAAQCCGMDAVPSQLMSSHHHEVVHDPMAERSSSVSSSQHSIVAKSQNAADPRRRPEWFNPTCRQRVIGESSTSPSKRHRSRSARFRRRLCSQHV